jgi:hypothetical protein
MTMSVTEKTSASPRGAFLRFLIEIADVNSEQASCPETTSCLYEHLYCHFLPQPIGCSASALSDTVRPHSVKIESSETVE